MFATLLLLLAPALPQGTVGLDSCLELPNFATGDSDHAVVAFNDQGDAFVAWHSRREDLFGSPRQVEGAYLRYMGNDTWEIPDPQEDHFLIADPSLALVGPIDNCRKPDVVAIGSDFVVCWPRGSNYGSVIHQLEVVRLQVGASGPAVLDRPLPGMGYVVDSQVNNGEAGIMPDLATLDPAGIAAVVYAHEENAAGPYREYDLRMVELDFSGATPSFSNPLVLDDNFPMDASQVTGLPGGGLVLPDAVVDDFGYLVVAHEEYVRKDHQNAPRDIGAVVLQRFQKVGASMRMLEEVSFPGKAMDNRQRRPNVAASRHDGVNSVSLTWMDNPDAPGADVDVAHLEVEFLGGASAGALLFHKMDYPNSPTRSDTQPVPLQGEQLRLSFAVRALPSGVRKIPVWIGVPGGILQEAPSCSNDPWRPAVDLWEQAPYGQVGSRRMVLSHEGSNATGLLRIFVNFQAF
ncbi:MAG: hypothetical protein DWQ01_21740 [Planctomycetota bacterium]|nr:MAG: hypothetical protein DWQ01_21740 [Planctomycetota bacterium]